MYELFNTELHAFLKRSSHVVIPRVGVIGPGDIGEVIVRKVKDQSYPVKMANSRGPESLKDLAAKTGAIPVSVEQVVQDVDVLFLVVP